MLGALCVPFSGKEKAVEAGAVEALLTMLGSMNLTHKTCASSAMMNVTVDITAKKRFMEAGGVGVLCDVMEVDDEKLVLNALQIVANVSEYAPAKLDLRVLGPKLSSLMTHHIAVLKRHAMLAKLAIDFEQVGVPCGSAGGLM